MRAGILFLLVSFVVFGVLGECSGYGLGMNFYEKSCPQAEKIVRNITWTLTAADPGLAADLLRLHYHDCFVRGCDASVLLDSTKTNKSEKEDELNRSLAGFEEIDEIKSKIEEECPGVVSCADILALAARDAVAFQFKKSMWQVLTGRKDGRVSLQSEVPGNLPSPFSNFTTLRHLFESKNFNLKDLVALSGAHTIGEAHCDAFEKRLSNFDGKGGLDPSLDTSYAKFLEAKCPKHFKLNTTVVMDPESSVTFDTHYFKILYEKKGLFQSDAALLTNARSAMLAKRLQDPEYFFTQFAKSMKKMGAMEALTGNYGEIRKQCHVVN